MPDFTPLKEWRFSNGMRPGEPGGVDTAEANVADFEGEY
jgi:hypothetical protein